MAESDIRQSQAQSRNQWIKPVAAQTRCGPGTKLANLIRPFPFTYARSSRRRPRRLHRLLRPLKMDADGDASKPPPDTTAELAAIEAPKKK